MWSFFTSLELVAFFLVSIMAHRPLSMASDQSGDHHGANAAWIELCEKQAKEAAIELVKACYVYIKPNQGKIFFILHDLLFTKKNMSCWK